MQFADQIGWLLALIPLLKPSTAMAASAKANMSVGLQCIVYLSTGISEFDSSVHVR